MVKQYRDYLSMTMSVVPKLIDQSAVQRTERRMTMENDLILTRLRNLRLPGMAEALIDLLKLPVQMRPSLEKAVSKMIDTEIRSRDDNRTARLLKLAKIPETVLIEQITCRQTETLLWTNCLLCRIVDLCVGARTCL